MSTVDDATKEVFFSLYCPTCKHEKKYGYEDPCDECLTMAAREGTFKPMNWEAKDDGTN